MSEFWKALTSQLQVQLNLSTAYHPQTDGQTEWVNQILEQYLHVYCSYQQDDWVNFLGIAEFQYNNSHHDAIQTSPFFANYGFHPTFASVPGRTQNPAASTFASHLDSIKEELRSELELAQNAAKRHYDAKRAPSPVFRTGEYVMLLQCSLQSNHPSGKLDYQKIGPFKILYRVGKNVYWLILPTSLSRLHPVFNVNLLEQYIAPTRYKGRLELSHPAANLGLALEGENLLKFKKIIDVRKIG